jgi:hypothetical protein
MDLIPTEETLASGFNRSFEFGLDSIARGVPVQRQQFRSQALALVQTFGCRAPGLAQSEPQSSVPGQALDLPR